MGIERLSWVSSAHGLQSFTLVSECWGAIEGYTVGECPALLCMSNLSAYFYEEGTIDGKQRQEAR